MKKILTFSIIFFLFTTLSFAQIEIDGDMLDWADIPALDQGEAMEVLGDIGSTDYSMFDLKHLYITHDSSNVYVRIDIDDAASFNDFYNFANPPVFEFYMDTEIADTNGFDWGWWNNAYNYYINLAPNLHPDSTNKTAELYLYTGNRLPTYVEGEFVLLANIPMAINDDRNSLEFSIPRDQVNFGSEFRPWVYSVGDFQWDLGADQLPTEGGDYMLKYDFWSGGSYYNAHAAQIVTPIEIDGDLLDWASIPAADINEIAEELGDMATGPEFDLMDFYITSDSSNVYVRIDIDPSATFSGIYSNYTNQSAFQIFFDTSIGDTTGLGYGGFWRLPADYMVDLSAALHPDSLSNEVPIYRYIADWAGAFEEFGEVEGAMATFAKNDDDNVVEISIPRAAINAGTDIRTWVYVVGDENWDNEEYFPNSVHEGWSESVPEMYYALDYNFVTGPNVITLNDKSMVTSVESTIDSKLVTDEFSLVGNYPNPFNPSTIIEFTLNNKASVDVKVFDVLGREVASIINNKNLTSGTHRVNWNGIDKSGNSVTSGVYFYQISSGKNFVTKKMMLLK
ncbi:MAG: T9SS type A sorting domain-containing protein [Ignavibacteriae bacterium]|nr:T9SS type A sorting domain-containing protein [Ignavibacteriota bacterium]MCB9075912.1 T9SS type A sorting domain-containing protein [Chitinophagales bacterium]